MKTFQRCKLLSVAILRAVVNQKQCSSHKLALLFLRLIGQDYQAFPFTCSCSLFLVVAIFLLQWLCIVVFSVLQVFCPTLLLL